MLNQTPHAETRTTLLPHAYVRPTVLLTGFILLALGVVLILRTRGLPRDANERGENIGQAISQASPKGIVTAGSNGVTSSSKGVRVTSEEVFDNEVKEYKAKLNLLDTNIKLQGLFVVFTVLLLLRRSDTLNLFGNQIPLQWLHLFAPLIMIYLWLNFGFLLDYLIYTRLWGVQEITGFHKELDHQGKLLFQDSGFVDGWFLTYVDRGCKNGYSGINPNSWRPTGILLVAVFGTLFSATHACILGITFVGCRRYLRQRFPKRFLGVYYLLPLIPLTVLLVSHFQFAYGGHNRNRMQWYISLLTIPLFVLLLWISVLVDRKVEPSSVECLTRQRRRFQACEATIPDDDSDEPPKTIALIGDSLSTGFHVGSGPGMLWRMWFGWKDGWFTNLSPGKADSTTKADIDSFVERVSRLTSVFVASHASVGAKVDRGGKRNLSDMLTNTWHFSHQVDEVLAGPFPNLLLVWIGHNNMDWLDDVDKWTEETCEQLSTKFMQSYRHQVDKLVKAAVRGRKKSTIVVFGLIDFESFFRARDEAEARHLADEKCYPYFQKGYRYFMSMQRKSDLTERQPRDHMIELALSCNEKLEAMCLTLRGELQKTNVRLVYSDALYRAPIAEADKLNNIDAWHPSAAGHNVLAESAFDAVKKQLRYLG